MQKKNTIKAAAAALGAALTLAVAPAAMAASTSVKVTIKGKTRTLVATRTVQVGTGWITRGGAPSGKCPVASAQGALNVATHGKWKGSWSKTYSEYYITAIMGDTETGKKYYWGLYVNGKLASKGACDIKLKSGERLLFKVTG